MSPQSASEFMPKGKEAQRTLAERAQLLSIELTKFEKINKIPYIRFRLGSNEFYGVGYEMAKEVLTSSVPTFVPFAPLHVAGVINHRGALICVIDLKKLFQIEQSENDHTLPIILLANEAVTVGILVDAIMGLETYEEEGLNESLASFGGISPEYIIGLHQGKTAIINVNAILSDILMDTRVS